MTHPHIILHLVNDNVHLQLCTGNNNVISELLDHYNITLVVSKPLNPIIFIISISSSDFPTIAAAENNNQQMYIVLLKQVIYTDILFTAWQRSLKIFKVIPKFTLIFSDLLIASLLLSKK